MGARETASYLADRLRGLPHPEAGVYTRRQGRRFTGALEALRAPGGRSIGELVAAMRAHAGERITSAIGGRPVSPVLRGAVAELGEVLRALAPGDRHKAKTLALVLRWCGVAALVVPACAHVPFGAWWLRYAGKALRRMSRSCKASRCLCAVVPASRMSPRSARNNSLAR